VLLRLSKQESIYGCQFEGIRHDCGDKMGLLNATVDLALKREDFNGS
jgi:UTP--glucose-1-phosphate uridylyltransferase